MHVGLAHPNRQRLREGAAHGHLVEEPAVNAGNRHDAALAAGLDGLTERVGPVGAEPHRHLRAVVQSVEARAVGLGAYRVDARVGAAAAGSLLELLDDVGDLHVVDGLGLPLRLGHEQPNLPSVDGNHPVGF